jgi:GNAT superfamily N-acetyltransferase
LKIRQATVSDLEEIVRYAVAIALQHQDFNPVRFKVFPDHLNLVREYFREELSSDRSIINLLCQDEEVVGYSFVKIEEASVEKLTAQGAWLHDIFIDEKVRGSGGGKMLLEASKDAAKRLGSTSLMLHVATQNAYARKFFESNGFGETSTEMMVVF